MGTQRTPPQNPAGIGTLLPLRQWTGTTTSDTAGGGFDVLDIEAGPVTPDSDTPLALEASGTPTIYGPNVDITVQVVRAGFGGQGSEQAGVAYYTGANGWFGRERHSLLSGYQCVNDFGTDDVRNPSAVALSDGTIVLGVENDTDNAFEIWTRSTAGAWTQAEVFSNATEDGVVILAPDGSLHAYMWQPPVGMSSLRLALYRSDDGGANWTLQRNDCLGYDQTSGSRRLVGCTDASGGVVLFEIAGTGTATTVTQYASSDGGYVFQPVLVGSSRAMVYNVALVDGLVHAVSCEYSGASDMWYHRKIASAFEPLISGPRVQIATGGSFDEEASAIIVSPDPGVILVSYKGDSTTSNDLVSRRSEDGGATWLSRDIGPNWVHSASASYEAGFHLCAVVQRQTVLVFSTNRSFGELYEMRYGGNTNVTLGTNIERLDRRTFIPFGNDTTATWGWTNTDTGVVTRVSNATRGERITAALLATSDTIAANASATPAVAHVCVRPVSGANNLISVRLSGQTDTVVVDLRTVTGAPGTLEIRCYDEGGAAPAYTVIGTEGEFVELAIVCSGASAYVWWRLQRAGFERDWNTTGAGAITLGAASRAATRLLMQVINGDEADILHAWVSFPATTSLANGITAPEELFPIPISPRQTYLTQGVSVRHVGGLVKVDLTDHDIGYTSPWRGENIAPDYSPSPRTPWRSASQAVQAFSWSLTDDIGGSYTAVYVAGLRNIETMTIDTGASATTCSTVTAFKYDTVADRSIKGTTSGTKTVVRWVRADELVGCQVKLASGTWRTIVGNSEGWLTYGTGANEYRAIIHLDGAHDGGTNKTGSLVSSSIWLITDDVSSTLSISVPGTPTNSSTSDGYRQIGVVAPFRIHALGLAPDLDDQWARSDASDIQTLPDGRRYIARRAPDRRRVRVAYVGSGHEVQQQESTTATGDYVVLTSGGRAAGDWTGVPYTMDGIVARAGGKPVLWLPNIPDIAGPTVYRFVETPIGKQPLYGRIVGGVGFEGIPLVGARGLSQMFRVPAVTIEEET